MYNAKIMCVSKNRLSGSFFTVNKIYDVIDGFLTDDRGKSYPSSEKIFESIDELNSRLAYILFVEIEKYESEIDRYLTTGNIVVIQKDIKHKDSFLNCESYLVIGDVLMCSDQNTYLKVDYFKSIYKEFDYIQILTRLGGLSSFNNCFVYQNNFELSMSSYPDTTNSYQILFEYKKTKKMTIKELIKIAEKSTGYNIELKEED